MKNGVKNNMEIFDMYDKNRIKTGQTMARGTKVPEGCYRLVIHVCIINSEGKMLIQQRQPFKHGWSGMWDISCGGSAVSGEDSETAAEREIVEELGLSISLKDVRPKINVNFDDGFDDYYVLKQDVDISSLKLQPEEVKAAKWADKMEIFSMIDNGDFIPYNKSLIELLFSFADHTGCHTAEDKTERKW